MRTSPSRLQQRVLERLAAGQPPTRWQQFQLHLRTLARQFRRRRFGTLGFHGRGLARTLWQPFTVGRLFAVPVQFHSTWFLYPAGVIVGSYFDPSDPWQLAVALLVLLLFCLSLLIHEFAHILTARKFGLGTSRVIFIPPGAAALLESPPAGPAEFWIALAGPLASLLLAGVFWLLLLPLGQPWDDWQTGVMWRQELRHLLELGCALNLILAGFNVLPCFPMDGGRMLRSALAVILGRFSPGPTGSAALLATRITVRGVAWPVALVMLVRATQEPGGWIYLLLFPLLLLAAEIEYQTLAENHRT